MAAESKPYLHTRADGFTETPDGELAVVMRVRTGCDAELCWFKFRSSFAADPVRVEWPAGDKLQLFSGEVVPSLLRTGYARLPRPEEIAAFLAGDLPVPDPETAAVAEMPLAPVAEPVVEPVAETPAAAPPAAETPAPLPVATPATETAPQAAPVAASTEEAAPAAPVAEQPAPVAEPEAEIVPPAPVAAPKSSVVTAPPAKKKS